MARRRKSTESGSRRQAPQMYSLKVTLAGIALGLLGAIPIVGLVAHTYGFDSGVRSQAPVIQQARTDAREDGRTRGYSRGFLDGYHGAAPTREDLEAPDLSDRLEGTVKFGKRCGDTRARDHEARAALVDYIKRGADPY